MARINKQVILIFEEVLYSDGLTETTVQRNAWHVLARNQMLTAYVIDDLARVHQPRMRVRDRKQLMYVRRLIRARLSVFFIIARVRFVSSSALGCSALGLFRFPLLQARISENLESVI
jgi:hypothetical protein